MKQETQPGRPARAWAAVRQQWEAWAFFGLSLVLYAATAAPSVATIFDDSLEFHVVLPTLGIAHPSGYPLYTLLGKLATLIIPFRDPAGRANLFSALAAALAISLLYLTGRRLTGSRPAAAVATAAFALSPAWWSQATLAEVYALHGALMLLFIYLLLRWSDDHGAATPISPHPFRLLQAAFLVFGLGLAHHRMIVLLLPAALVLILWTVGPRAAAAAKSPRPWALLIVPALAPLLLYAYLPIRGQTVGSLDGTFRPTLQGTVDWIFARDYGVFLTGNPFGVQRDAAFFIGLFVQQLTTLPVLAALLGLATGWRYGWRRYVFLLLATAGQTAFGVAYKVQDVEVFFIPAFILSTLWAALGLASVFAGAADASRHLRRSRRLAPLVSGGVAALVVAVVLAGPIVAAYRDWDRRDLSRKWDVYDYGQDMLTAVAPGGRIVGLLGETTLIRYFRDVLGRRTDVMVVPADREADRFAAVDAALAAGVPVYLTRDLPGAAGRYSLDAAGPLIAVSRKAAPTAPTGGRPAAADILLYDLQTDVRQTHAGPVIRVMPTWVAAAGIAVELKVSARLLDAQGRQLAQNDRVPVHFAYPTTAWVMGEEVRDSYDLAVPRAAGPGPYRVLLIWYRAADGQEVGRVEVAVRP